MSHVTSTHALDESHPAPFWGFEDAVQGKDQRGSAYFPIGSAKWDAYNVGYAEGAALLSAVTGKTVHAWRPDHETTCVSNNVKRSKPYDHRSNQTPTLISLRP